MRYTHFYLIILSLSFGYLKAEKQIIVNNISNYKISFVIEKENDVKETKEVLSDETSSFPLTNKISSVTFNREKTTFESLKSKEPLPEIKTFSKEELAKTQYIVIYLDETNQIRAEASTPLHLLSSRETPHKFSRKDTAAIINTFSANQTLFKEALSKLLLEAPELEELPAGYWDKDSKKNKETNKQDLLQWNKLVAEARTKIGKETLYSIMEGKELPTDKLSYKELIIDLMWRLFEVLPERNDLDRSTVFFVGESAEKIGKFLQDYVILINPTLTTALLPTTPHTYQYPSGFDRSRYGIDVDMPLLPNNAFHINFGSIPSMRKIVYLSNNTSEIIIIRGHFTIQLEPRGIGKGRAASAIASKVSTAAASAFAYTSNLFSKTSKEEVPSKPSVAKKRPIKIDGSYLHRPAPFAKPAQSGSKPAPSSRPSPSSSKPSPSTSRPTHTSAEDHPVFLTNRVKEAFQILEINSNASEEDVTKAYRRLALKYHPDKNHDPAALEKMQEINTAKETLNKHFENRK